jgi:hypothetical protein
VWRAAAACPGGAGARVSAIASLPASGPPPAAAVGAETRLGLGGALVAAAAPGGRVAVIGRPPASASAVALQGRAGGAFSAIEPEPVFAPPFAATNAYLGDLAVAGGSSSGDLQLQVERFYATSFERRSLIMGGPGVRLLTPALDYRSDALLVWQLGGWIYARFLPASGGQEEPQRLAPAGPNLRISALLSDDRRAIVAWSEQQGPLTKVYLDRSASGVAFGAPRLLESFENPAQTASAASSPSLIRLSTESVMVAWSSISEGHWVIRSAAVDQERVGPPTTTSSPGGDALLAGLEPGPKADAMLLWTEPRPAGPAAGGSPEQAVWAAREFRGQDSRVVVEAPQEVAPAGPNSEPAIAVDPDSDRPVTVWRDGQLLRYSVGEPGAPR